MISFIFFDATGIFVDDMKESVVAIGSLFGFGGIPFISAETLHYIASYATLFVFAIIGATPLLKNVIVKIKATATGEKVINLVEPIVLAGIFVIITASLVDGAFSPFLYFQF
jgi:alginate O-acetyltransferase complex protein AlgI